MAESWVYFIRPTGHDGPIKIGHTADCERRLAEISVWTPYPLEIVGKIPGGRDLEARLHAHLAAHWSHGEWFRADPAVLALIDSLILGNLDHEALSGGSGAGPRRYPVAARRARSLQMRICWAKRALADAVPACVIEAGRNLNFKQPLEFEKNCAIIEAWLLVNAPRPRAA